MEDCFYSRCDSMRRDARRDGLSVPVNVFRSRIAAYASASRRDAKENGRIGRSRRTTTLWDSCYLRWVTVGRYVAGGWLRRVRARSYINKRSAERHQKKRRRCQDSIMYSVSHGGPIKNTNDTALSLTTSKIFSRKIAG